MNGANKAIVIILILFSIIVVKELNYPSQSDNLRYDELSRVL